MSTFLDSFCPQAYGAGKRHHVVLYFQGILNGYLPSYFPIKYSLVELWVKLLIVCVDQDSIEMAQLYLRIVTFGGPGLLLFETGKRYLQAQNIYSADLCPNFRLNLQLLSQLDISME
ncbi:uncharacterized protein PRCAT00001333001 [Priceomyces carsonii]|uniref:uncharacterized protein n=1 Tax=Priceomyces carsonii TaxID=28549 RepID=UPI002ED7C268|nr:unnamed protein product [Priceomyces carsonii]